MMPKSLAIRTHICDRRNLILDHDHNTSINILKKGLDIFGIVLSIYGDRNDSLRFFDRVIDNKNDVRQETLVAAYVNKGVVLMERGDHKASLTYFDKALELEPNRLGAIINKANALQDLDRLDEAAVYFHKAWSIDKDPLSWKPRFVIIKAMGGIATS